MSLMKRLKLVKKRASLSTYYSLWGSLVYLGEAARSSSHILRSRGLGQYALNIVLSIQHPNLWQGKLLSFEALFLITCTYWNF